MFQQNITSPTTMLSGYLQRLSASFGFNSTPTTYEFDIVTENNQDFDFNSAYPGKLLSFSLGNLRFGGIIQSWSENFGPNGKTYSVRAADPRLIFANIPLILDGRGLSTGVVVDNYLNVFQYYGSPQSADSTKDGMTFSKIREFLSTTGIINAYGSKFQLQFTSGFLDASGSFNPSGIPYWYRINSSEVTLDQLLQQVSQDFGMDYYAEVDYNTFNPTGTLNTLYIKHIYRNVVSDGSDISGFVVGAKNSGVLQSYKRGQELRTDPTTVVALGPDLEYWKFPQSNEIQCYWGRYHDGSALTTSTSFMSGIVLLDHITGSGSQYINNTIPVTTVTISKTPQGVYPPRNIRSTTVVQVSGYYAGGNVLRASLFGRETWEEVLVSENPVFASGLGMSRYRFLREDDFAAISYSGFRNSIALVALGSGITDRDPTKDEVIDAVYDATKRVAENFWGKTWLLTVDSSNWYNSSSYDSSELIPRLEFDDGGYIWSELSRGLPSGSTLNHPVLSASNKPSFRDEVGKIHSFLSIPNYTTNPHSTFPQPVDLSNQSVENFLIDQGDKLVVPVNLEKYEKNPTQFIATLPFNIQGLSSGNLYKEKRYFYDFLKYCGFTQQNIKDFNLIQNIDEGHRFGLMPPRMFFVPHSFDQYGFFIALKRTEKNFGGFIASGNRPGGVRIIQDSSLAPWTYGGYSGFLTAGNTIVGRSTSTSTVLDNADLNIVGLPPYNLGDSIGSSSQITSATCQFGPDGFSTNYSVRTFAQPRNQLSKVLFDKITNIRTGFAIQQKEILKLKGLKTEKQKEELPTAQSLQKLFNEIAKDGSYTIGVVIPTNSGVYDPNFNPIP